MIPIWSLKQLIIEATGCDLKIRQGDGEADTQAYANL